MEKEMIDDIHQILIAVIERRERVAEQIRTYDATGDKFFPVRDLMVDAINRLDDVIGRINVVIAALREGKA